MINYKSESEKIFVFFYAKKFDDKTILNILNKGEVKNSQEAIYLSQFFWKMVDSVIQDENERNEVPWKEKSELISEKIMRTFSGYLEKNGYEKEWESVSDQQG